MTLHALAYLLVITFISSVYPMGIFDEPNQVAEPHGTKRKALDQEQAQNSDSDSTQTIEDIQQPLITSSNTSNSIACALCTLYFDSARGLKIHNHRVHNISTGSHTCTFEGCGKSFTQNFNLTEHARIHTGKKPYTCDFDACGKSFTQKNSLTEHARIHTGEKPYTCDFDACGKSFTQKSHLIIHARIHTGEKPYACDFDACGKSFAQNRQLTYHTITHTGEKPYVCDFAGCDKAYASSTNLKKHKKSKHT